MPPGGNRFTAGAVNGRALGGGTFHGTTGGDLPRTGEAVLPGTSGGALSGITGDGLPRTGGAALLGLPLNGGGGLQLLLLLLLLLLLASGGHVAPVGMTLGGRSRSSQTSMGRSGPPGHAHFGVSAIGSNSGTFLVGIGAIGSRDFVRQAVFGCGSSFFFLVCGPSAAAETSSWREVKPGIVQGCEPLRRSQGDGKCFSGWYS